MWMMCADAEQDLKSPLPCSLLTSIEDIVAVHEQPNAVRQCDIRCVDRAQLLPHLPAMVERFQQLSEVNLSWKYAPCLVSSGRC